LILAVDIFVLRADFALNFPTGLLLSDIDMMTHGYFGFDFFCCGVDELKFFIHIVFQQTETAIFTEGLLADIGILIEIIEIEPLKFIMIRLAFDFFLGNKFPG
jgi:hypothetical protein